MAEIDNNVMLCDNPISLDEIEKGLWLGSFTAATDVETLKQRNITHILTLDICPLPVHITEIPFLTTKFIHVSDTPKDDILGHFEECCDFVENAIANGKTILVHCYYGVSRSATIVIAYVMRKYKLSTTPAYERVKAKRIFVRPNAGFMIQLRLFHKMGWKIDPFHEKFKVYRMRLAADKVRMAKILPQSCMDLVKADPALTQSKPEPIVYRCKKCRRIVAAKSNLITHTRVSPAATATATVAVISAPNIAPSAITTTSAIVHATNEHSTSANQMSELVTKMNTQLGVHSTNSSDRSMDLPDQQPRCTEMLFIEPLTWMVDVCKQTQGKLNCPKCQSKLGNFTWINACNCPCGKNVSPAFYLVPSKVELSHSVKNVEITV